MQTDQPIEKVHVPMFSAEDVVKKRDRHYRAEIPSDLIAKVLESWVTHQGWAKPVAEEFRCGLIERDFANLVYRYGYQKRMLPQEQWSPGWGRRPRKAGKGLEPPKPGGQEAYTQWSTAALTQRFKALDDRINALGRLPLVEDWMTNEDFVRQLKYLLNRVEDWDSVMADFKHHQKQATPASELAYRMSDLDKEIVRLAGIMELERTASTDLLERIVKIENKLRGGGRRGPTLPTKLHREIRRRLRILIAGGK